MNIIDAITDSQRPKFNAPPQINKSCLVIGDAQAPFHDAQFLNKIKKVTFAYGVKTCIWCGDMIDFHAISIFLSQKKTSIEEELVEDEIALGQIADGFDDVLWVAGNHDERMSRMLTEWIPIDRLRLMLRLDDLVKTTDYYYCFIGKQWMATHPKNSSVIPARIPSMLAQKYQRNTISFHGHLNGMVMYNDFWCIDAGVVCDPDRLEYSSVRQSTRPKVQRGAVLMLKDHQGVFHPRVLNDLTDWELEEQSGKVWRRRNEK